MKIRWIVVGALALGVPTVGLMQTISLLLLAACLVIPGAGIHTAITMGPRQPNPRERLLLTSQGIDIEALPEDWRELAFRQWETVQTTFEQSAVLLFPGQRDRQGRWVNGCWMRWELRQLEIDRAKAAQNNVRQLAIR
mgnify:CR=1 FL=1